MYLARQNQYSEGTHGRKSNGEAKQRLPPHLPQGRSAVSGGVVVYCLKNRQGMSRLGVTVSTKLGHAVVRNRVRRRFRELYRLHRADMLPGWDIIMVGRVRAAELPYHKLEKQYLRCLAELGLLREDV